MATKEVKQNLEQCSVTVVDGATIALAILEQRWRKLSAGYLQNCDLQFPNLTHVCPRLLFTLDFSYKKGHASHKNGSKELTLEKIKRKRRKQSELKGTDAASLKSPESYLDSIFVVLTCSSLTL